MINKKTILYFIVLTVSITATAQNLAPEITNYGSVSPNSASLGKFGTFPVNYNLGAVNVNIPLYTLDSGKQQVPIGLSYNTGGIKVNDLASWVGLGWTLNAGGAIIRNVKGIPDDFSDQGIEDLENAAFNSTNFNYIYDCWKGLKDSQPDELILNAPGISGTFQLNPDQNGTVVFNDHQVAKVIAQQDDAQNPGRIEVIKPDGTKLIFGTSVIEENGQFHKASEYSRTSTTNFINSYEYISTWYLTEMIEPTKKDTIRFRYADNLNHDFPEASGEYATGTVNSTIQGSYPEIKNIEQKILSRIETNNGYVVFNTSGGRSDLEGELKLDKVEMYTGQFGEPNAIKINEYVFIYGYFQRHGGNFSPGSSSGVGFDKSDSRTKSMRLDTIAVGNDGVGGTYSFAYNGTSLPKRGSTAQDQWGYANSNTGSFMPRTVGTYYPNAVPAVNYDVGTGNRKSDPIKMKAASLERINYPTGGHTVFELEPHQRTFLQTTSSPVQDGDPAQAYGSECDASIGQSLVTKTVVIPHDVIGDVKLSITFSEAASVQNGAYVKFNGITYNATGGTGGEELEGGNREFSFNLSPGTYTLEVSEGRTGAPSGAAVSCPFTTGYVSWFVPGPSVNTEVTEYHGGLRVASIKNYDGFQTEPTSQKYFEYENINVLRPYRNEAYKHFYLPDGGDFVNDNIKLKLSTGEYFNNNLDNRPVVEYGTITEYVTDNQGIQLGKTVYEYNTLAPQRILGSGLESPVPFKHPSSTGEYHTPGFAAVRQDDDFTYWRSDGWKYGTLAHKHVYKNTATQGDPVYVKMQQLDHTYSTLVESEIMSNYIFANIHNPEIFEPYYPGSFDMPWDALNDRASYIFSYYVAKKSLGKKVIDQTISTIYDEDGLNPMITTTDYVYGNTAHQQPTLVKTTNSLGQLQETITSYPDDVTSESSLEGPNLKPSEKQAIDNLKTTGILHRITEAVQVKALVKDASNNILSSNIQRTNYQDWGSNLVLPKSVSTLKDGYNASANPMEDRITYHNYDDNGNPVEVSKANGAHTYYVWGYNSAYPIAKLENFTDSHAIAIQSTIDAAINASNADTDDNSEIVLRAALKNLRDAASSALATTYTYDPLIGVTSITDPRGNTVYYTYDAFNRLKEVKDASGNLVTDYKYHYKGQSQQ
ncbi:RHS repeat domain-containing protein [Flagellimonas pacifica]|nr:RHS repeat domain-containing protein [Allomuricauda parva]